MLLALLPRWAEAHPVDEVVQGAYLTLAPGEVRLELLLLGACELLGRLLGHRGSVVGRAGAQVCGSRGSRAITSSARLRLAASTIRARSARASMRPTAMFSAALR